MIHHLQESRKLRPDVALAFIYFNYKESDGHNLVNILASLIHQICRLQGRLPAELIDLFEKHNAKSTRPSVHELSSLLRAAVGGFSKTLIVLDALDECPEKDGMREHFITELLGLQPQVQLLVTSRIIPMIERQLADAKRVDIRASDEDIKTYLLERMNSSGKMKGYFDKDQELRSKITGTIIGKAGGMFLQARLHLDSLIAKTNLRKLKVALDSLPEGLDETYDEVVERINTQNADDSALAWKVLGWILHSAQPLTVIELQHALAVEPGDSYLDEDSITGEELLTSVCGGIVTIQSESTTIGLVHLSTQGYLMKNSKKLFPETEKDMVQSCIDYLSLDEFSSGPCDLGQAMQRRRQNYPLYSYASRHWGVHAILQNDQDLLDTIIAFLDDEQKLSGSIQIVSIHAQEGSEIPPASPRSVSAIGVAAFFGLVAVVKVLIQRGDNVNIKDGYGLTPLHQSDRPEVSTVLLNNGADVAARDGYGRTPLHQAAWQGAVGVMEVLLAHGAALVDRNEMGNTPLHEATQNEKLSSVRFLIDQKSDVNARNIYGITPLHLASRQGNATLVDLLLNNKANIQATTDYGESALSMAALRGHETVIRILFERQIAQGLQPSRHDDIVVKSLLGEQKINDTDAQGRTVLHLVCAGGTLRYIEELLKRGADARALDKQQRTCLHHAATAGSSKAIKRLLEVGLDPCATDLDGWTPLHWAAKGGKIGNIQLLLESGADPTVRCGAGWTPLAVAKYQGLKSAVGTLEAAQRSVASNIALPDLKKVTESLFPPSPLDKTSLPSPGPPPLMNHASDDDIMMLLSNVQSSIGRAFIHRGIICDGCDLDVYDPRYKCMNCADFDLCFKCVKTAALAHPRHQFQSINLARNIVSREHLDIVDSHSNDDAIPQATATGDDTIRVLVEKEPELGEEAIDIGKTLNPLKADSRTEIRHDSETVSSEKDLLRQDNSPEKQDHHLAKVLDPLRPSKLPQDDSENFITPDISVVKHTAEEDGSPHGIHRIPLPDLANDELSAFLSRSDLQIYEDKKAQGASADDGKLDSDLETYRYRFGEGERTLLRDVLIAKRTEAHLLRGKGLEKASVEQDADRDDGRTVVEAGLKRSVELGTEVAQSEESEITLSQGLSNESTKKILVSPESKARPMADDDDEKQRTQEVPGPTPGLIEGSTKGRHRGVTGYRHALADLARRNSWDEGDVHVSKGGLGPDHDDRCNEPKRDPDPTRDHSTESNARNPP